ncbi:MAG: restriction endonuclease [Bacteroidales bacterium]|nr:restriction endonuclease [Bacteroidales bacterium]
MNTPEPPKMGRARSLGARLNYKTLEILNEQDGGSMPVGELKKLIAEKLQFDEWESYEYNAGNPRWRVNWHFYSVDLCKSGFMVKNNGEWCITDEGRKALQTFKDDPTHLFYETHRRYLEWEKKNKNKAQTTPAEEEEIIDNVPNAVILDNIKQQANDDIRKYLDDRNAYEFQDLVAALFRAMGYYTPFIAPRGKDGGIDIIAYSDPLGATEPRLKVQVKHYNIQSPVSVDVVHRILGVAKKDVPIIVSSGRFTEDARITARQNNVRLIDGTEFIDLWIKYYNKLSENDKMLMPIEPVFFIKRSE